jgi:AraC-like DNA-binding protein/tetratricopeptide (TPR) repeat protein
MYRQPAEDRSQQAAPLPRGVRRACDAMRADPARDFDLAELAAIAGAPARTLQRQFRNFLGKGPLEMLRDLRYEAARRELLRGGPDARVTDIAARCGLTHFGRFSVEYRRRYGENPSATLARQGVQPATPPSTPRIAAFSRERPTIAVVETEAPGLDRMVGRELTDALTTALVRSGYAVTTDPRAARYRLTSTLRNGAVEARLTCRLIDAASGLIVWAHQQEGVAPEALAFDERLASQIAAAMQPGLRTAEIARAGAKADADLTAYDLTLRAMPLALQLDGEAASRALELVEQAIARDGDNALASALGAWCHAQRVIYQFTADAAGESRRAVELANRAVRPDSDATTLAIVGNALSSAHQLGAAGHVIDRALALDGGSAWAWGRSGWIDVYTGRPDRAIERFATALELAPNDPLVFNWFVGLGNAHFAAGRYRDAAHCLERGIAEHPSAVWTHRVLCPAYVMADRKAEAELSLAVMRREYADLTISQVTAAIPLPPAVRARVANGLDSLGVDPGASG